MVVESKNPWLTQNIDDFFFLCCPECDYKSKFKEVFKDHAIENHPKSKDSDIFKKTVPKPQHDAELKTELVLSTSEKKVKVSPTKTTNLSREPKYHDERLPPGKKILLIFIRMCKKMAPFLTNLSLFRAITLHFFKLWQSLFTLTSHKKHSFCPKY